MFKRLSLKTLACLLAFSCFSPVPVLAATTRNAAWGISFQNPAGWQIQLTPQGYALAQAQQQQMMMLIPHTLLKMPELKAAIEAGQGLNDQNVQLSVAGEWQDISATISQIPVSGTINGGEVEGVILGVLSPVASRGVVVIALSNAGSWQASSGQAALALARSLRFEKKNNSQAINRLQQLLRGKSLTYSHNYTSTGGGGYVSSSTEAELHLCSNGRFQGRYQSMASVDAGGASAFSGDESPQSASGQWRVSDYLGEVVLELRPEGQAPAYFPVALSGGKLMLGGKGFRIGAGQQCR